VAKSDLANNAPRAFCDQFIFEPRRSRLWSNKTLPTEAPSEGGAKQLARQVAVRQFSVFQFSVSSPTWREQSCLETRAEVEQPSILHLHAPKSQLIRASLGSFLAADQFFDCSIFSSIFATHIVTLFCRFVAKLVRGCCACVRAFRECWPTDRTYISDYRAGLANSPVQSAAWLCSTSRIVPIRFESIRCVAFRAELSKTKANRRSKLEQLTVIFRGAQG